MVDWRAYFPLEVDVSRALLTVWLWLSCVQFAQAGSYPAPVEGDYVIRNFAFSSGEILPELTLHYTTIGAPVLDETGLVTNAVLILHGTGGRGGVFLTEQFAGSLFGAGQPLDARRYYLILPDSIGAGKSSKPSDGLRTRFPHYTYDDMVRAQYQLAVDKLHVNHLRLILGTSMGCMHAWMWAETYPQFMDALLPRLAYSVLDSIERFDEERSDHDEQQYGHEEDLRPLAEEVHAGAPAVHVAQRVGLLLLGNRAWCGGRGHSTHRIPGGLRVWLVLRRRLLVDTHPMLTALAAGVRV